MLQPTLQKGTTVLPSAPQQPTSLFPAATTTPLGQTPGLFPQQSASKPTETTSMFPQTSQQPTMFNQSSALAPPKVQTTPGSLFPGSKPFTEPQQMPASVFP